MSLHWQRAIRDFAFCFLRHNQDPGRKECNSNRVRTGRQEKGLFFQIFQLTWLYSVVYEWDSVIYQGQARPRNYASADAIFPTGQTKRGCEFLGLRILENIRRDWLTLAPDRLNRHDAISSKIARTELALTHCHARARGLRRRRDLQRDLHA